MARVALAGRDRYAVWRTLPTLWADNDVYGHVNNAVHYRWFDTAVNGWLIEAGLLDIAGGDPIGLVVETGCRFAASVAYPAPVEIGLAVTEVGRSSVRYRLGVFAVGAVDAAAEGHFVHVYVGRKSRRPSPLPDAWRSIFDGIKVSGGVD